MPIFRHILLSVAFAGAARAAWPARDALADGLARIAFDRILGDTDLRHSILHRLTAALSCWTLKATRRFPIDGKLSEGVMSADEFFAILAS